MAPAAAFSLNARLVAAERDFGQCDSAEPTSTSISALIARLVLQKRAGLQCNEAKVVRAN